MLKNYLIPRRVGFLLLAAVLISSAAFADTATCPANGAPLPTAAQRQAIVPIVLLRCFLPEAEIDILISSPGHDPQSAVTDPQFESGKRNPDGTLRPPLTPTEEAALIDMHTILDADMREGAVLRKVVANSDVGGILYGRTVITSGGKLLVVSTNTVRGFVGLERNTLGLDAGQTVAALGLDYETTDVGQFTDATDSPLHRQLSIAVEGHGLHSIRHIMSAQGASDAKIPLGKNLNDQVQAAAPDLTGRTFEMNRAGQSNPYTALGISDDIGMLKNDDPDTGYPLHLNEEDVMTVPTPLALGDQLIRRVSNGDETTVAVYTAVPADDGTVVNQWVPSPGLSAADAEYYQLLTARAASHVAVAGG
jgi:hypothetical protein